MNNSQAFTVLAVIGFSLIVGLVLIPAESAKQDVFFIEKTAGGNATGCTDLDCLTDVIISNPDNLQYFIFNETSGMWENTNELRVLIHSGIISTTLNLSYDYNTVVCIPDSGFDVTINLPAITDADIGKWFYIKNSGAVGKCTLDANGIETIDDLFTTYELDDFSESVLIGATSNTEWKIISSHYLTNGENMGTVGTGVFAGKSVNELLFKKLLAGTGITLVSNGTRITINNSLPESTTCNNVGTGNQLCSGDNVNIDTIIAGTGITISDTTDDWTFSSQCANTGTGEAICESSNNINSLIAGNGVSITDTTGDLTITNTQPELQIGQQVGDVYLSLTKTNIGNAYIDIYVTAFDEENMLIVDCANVTYGRVSYIWDYVGTGTQQLRWVNVANNTQVFYESPTFTSDRDSTDSGYFVKPSWCVGITSLEQQGKSTVAGDDPIAKGYIITVK
jgi:hypothetical protein